MGARIWISREQFMHEFNVTDAWIRNNSKHLNAAKKTFNGKVCRPLQFDARVLSKLFKPVCSLKTEKLRKTSVNRSTPNLRVVGEEFEDWLR